MPFKINSGESDHMASISDEDLFKAMQLRDSNSDEARRAWMQFYKRYSSYLWNCCLRVCKNITEGDDLAKDIFQSTMQKVYLQAKTFKPEKNRGVKAWISRIAYNEFIDHYNKYNQHFIFYEETPEIEDSIIEHEDDDESMNLFTALRHVQLKTLLSKLSAKEFKILMTCMNYYQIDNPTAHLPDTIMRNLCNEFGVQSDAIRQIKRRALLKLKNLMKEMVNK